MGQARIYILSSVTNKRLKWFPVVPCELQSAGQNTNENNDYQTSQKSLPFTLKTPTLILLYLLDVRSVFKVKM